MKGEREKEMFYLTTHSTHFIYSYMVSDIWLRTILIVRKETRCRHIGYSYRLTARVILYALSHRHDNTYHSLCYTSRGALAGTRNSSMGPPHEGSIRRPIAPWTNALPLSYVPLSMKEEWHILNYCGNNQVDILTSSYVILFLSEMTYKLLYWLCLLHTTNRLAPWANLYTCILVACWDLHRAVVGWLEYCFRDPVQQAEEVFLVGSGIRCIVKQCRVYLGTKHKITNLQMAQTGKSFVI